MKTENAKHTPTPWKVIHPSDVTISRQGNEQGKVIGIWSQCLDIAYLRQGNETNAAFIVRAVNSHDSMKTALEKALSLIWDEEKKSPKVPSGKAHDGATVEQVAWTIKSVIAKAEGRQ